MSHTQTTARTCFASMTLSQLVAWYEEATGTRPQLVGGSMPSREEMWSLCADVEART